MKSFRISLLVFLLIGLAMPVFAQSNPLPTTILFVRHAEKADDGTNNPPLNEAGEERAAHLLEVLNSEYEISSIFSTPYLRTKMTAQPLADHLNLEIQEYGFSNVREWMEEIINTHRGEAILIVGHSNTTPMLINLILGEERYEDLGEDDFGDIFIVSTTGIGSAEVTTSSF